MSAGLLPYPGDEGLGSGVGGGGAGTDIHAIRDDLREWKNPTRRSISLLRRARLGLAAPTNVAEEVFAGAIKQADPHQRLVGEHQVRMGTGLL